jgi:RimJ/RimL family protein N-acetyltransferase
VQNPFLIGTHIYLRPLELADAPAITPWFNDPEVNRNLLRYQPLSVHGEEEFLRKVTASETDVVLGVVAKEGDRLVGVTGLMNLDLRCRNAQFGINIGDKGAWGRGFGTEATRLVVRHAFETLNLHRVCLQVYEYNARGLHVYEKVGFRREGVLRQHTYRDGRYWDVITMAVLRAEWDAGPSGRA